MTLRRRAWLFSLAVLFAAPAFSQYDLEDELRRADKQFDLYAYNLALSSYQSVIEKSPSNSYAMTRIADCFFQLNKPAEALVWYDRATNASDAKPEVLLNYGKALMATGNYTSAKKWFLFYAQNDAKLGQHYVSMCDYAIANSKKEALYEASAEQMNSTASDFGAAFFGKKLVFNSARTDLAKRSKGSSDWSGTAYNQLLLTQRDAKNILQKPAFFKGDLANVFNEGPVSFAGNGSRVAYCKNNFVDGTRQIAESGITMNMYLADVDADGSWSNPKAFAWNAAEYSNGYPHLSDDGKTLLFASNRPGGEGGWDIYQSNWNGKSWTQPRNLGSRVNTAGNEISPFLEDETLYFSSDWHAGFGGMDVFKAEKTDAGDFSKILHLGPGINSPRDDYGFIFDSKENIGYLTSNRADGKGNEDIWRIRKRTEDFEIIVLDAAKKPIEGASLDFSNCGGKTMSTDANGNYSFSVAYGKADCEVVVKKEGFRDGEIEVKSESDKKITLILESDGIGKFIGQVLDYSTKKPLDEVQVNAIPVGKGAVVQATTDAAGAYSLTLESKKTYRISYLKEGFRDENISLETGSAKSKNDVSAIYLQNPSAGVSASADSKPATPVTYSTSTPVSKTKNTVEKVEPVAEKSTAKTAEKAAGKVETENVVEKSTAKTPAKAIANPVVSELKTSGSTKSANGFAVQVASMQGAASDSKLARYDLLRPYGNIYTRSGGKVTKVRVGVFSTKEEAVEVQKKATAMGFKGSFVMAENGVDESLVFSAPKAKPAATPAQTPAATPAQPIANSLKTKEKESEKPSKKEAKSEPKTESKPVRYAIQLASLANDQTVNLAPYMKITDVGNIYTRSENDFTKIRMGVWQNSDEAKKAQDALAKRGFKETVVVIETATASTEKFLIKSETPAKTSSTTTPKGGSKMVAAPKTYSLEEKPVAETSSIYKVRVATYTDADNFDPKTIASVKGTLERRKEGKNTIFLLSGYPDLETCQQARTLVQSLGYRDAQVVKDENGKLTKMKMY